MELNQLEIFCGVFRQRSFSRAAEALGLTQPTVSTRIKEFEEELGTPLFNRLGREIEPTDAGRFLYDQALPLLSQRQKLVASLATFLNRVEGPLVVGSSSAAGEQLLPELMMSFQAGHPEVGVELRFFGDNAKAMEELRTGGIDLGVLLPAHGRDDLVSEPFCDDELVLVAPATGELSTLKSASLAKLKTLPMIALHAGSATRATLEQALATKNLSLADLNVIAQFGRTAAIKGVVAKGYGVAFVSRRAVAVELASGALRVVPVVELGTMQLSYSLTYQRRREPSPTSRAFLEHARARLPHMA